ncbi:hypothetical protein ABIB81_009460 [Bradyrhizobium sp. I1.7.5]
MLTDRNGRNRSNECDCCTEDLSRIGAAVSLFRL